ncbi:MAG: WGR domain-containing protein, partial [Bacteroidia bacterium]|nr:WGR domain-containing protein [Bacteroidia bacterium]
SIKYFDIKNEYNEGANYFRKYLQYAELVSLGQLEAANNVLNAINNKNNFELSSGVVNHLKAEIEKLGYYATKNIGQSKFKCNLAVKKNEADETFLLGIILDDDKHYANNDILEQYLLKPEILKSNGWNICQIYSKDWIENKERVVKLIHAQLKNETFFDEIEVEVIKEIQELEQNALEQINSHSEQQNTFDRYISTANGSNKFWKICTDGANIIVQYGKVGTKGQRMIKAFGSEDEAKYEMNKLIAQKVAKDYVKENE